MSNNSKELKSCSALGCLNRGTDSDGLHFFPFPLDTERCLQWLLMCNRKDLISCTIETLHSNHFICSNHFHHTAFVKDHKKLLKITSVPTLHIKKDEEDTGENTTAKSGSCSYHNEAESNSSSADMVSMVLETPKISLNICRLCSESVIETSHMVNLLNDPEVLNQINSCLPVRISVTDPLPKCICTTCFSRLKNHCEFHRVVIESEHILREMFIDSNKNSFFNENASVSGYAAENVKDQNIFAQVMNDRENENMLIMIAEHDIEVDQIDSDKVFNQMVNVNEQEATFNEYQNESGHQNEFTIENSPSKGDNFSNNDYINKITDKVKPRESTDFYKIERNHFVCSVCEKKFTSERKLELHIKFHINEKPGSCIICDKSFQNENILYRHMWYSHGGGRKSNLQKSLTSREVSEYTILPSSGGKCSTCGKSFSNTAARLAHEEAQHSIKRECYQCFMCCEAFATEDQVTNHHLSEHSASVKIEQALKPVTINRLFQCEFCFKLYTKTSSLGDHRFNTHSHSPVYSCRFCKQEFSDHIELLSHIANASKDAVSHYKEDYPQRPVVRKFFCCHYCSKMYQSLKNMMDHQMRHQSEFEKMTDKNEARNLLASDIHQSEINLPMIPESSRLFICNFCSKQFPNETSLIKHNRTHTGEKPYKCDQCGKCFTQSSALTTHSKVHSDERPYSCTHCSQRFKIKSDCDSHEKTHSGERPFKCNVCNKSFMTKPVYSQHCKIHTDRRPYICQVCGEGFRRPHVLKVHSLRHSGEKPHNCHVCNKNYRQRGVLFKHLRKQHGIFEIPGNKNAKE